ncbi:MAG: ABC transporter substrate-binding protein [Chloroflexota bacterium]|nr:ABC transporter substrate-binding protein [Chloroflexota bacterium]
MSAISGATGLMLATRDGYERIPSGVASLRQEDFLEELVIDLSGTPESIDPALAYSPRDWSIVHSIYDALVGFDASGRIVPLAAESFAAVDDRTFEVVLRPGLTFHDGSPVDAAAVSRSVAYLQGSDSFAVDLFRGITGVEVIDVRTARIMCDQPSPWLPAQMAVWLLLVPEGFTAEQAATAPVGSGPYAFVSYAPGNEIVLRRNEGYTWGSPKGEPLAERVRYRFVPESSTRVADLSSGAARIVTDLPLDQLATVERAGQTAIDAPLVGSAWIRIATDVAPLDDARVRRALNHAIDVQAIATSLVSADARRLGNLYPDDRALGFDPGLQPYAYDPDLARSLLAEAGVAESLNLELEMTSSSQADVAEAITAQLGEVGVEISVVTSDDATFNAGWGDAARPALRMSTWVPLYDPHTLLSLVFASEGFLSRYGNGEVDRIIQRGASEIDSEDRDTTYRELGRVLHDDAPAIFLWNMIAAYGVAQDVSNWRPRGDEYVIPTVISDGAGS